MYKFHHDQVVKVFNTALINVIIDMAEDSSRYVNIKMTTKLAMVIFFIIITYGSTVQ